MLRLNHAAVQKLSCCLAIANANALCQLGNFIQIFAGLFGHAELAFPERGFNVLRSVPGKRDLEIVDERRAVHRDSRDEAAIHQVHQNGAETDFDHVPAHAPEDRFALLACGMHRGQKLPKALSGKNMRQGIQKFCQRYACGRRLGKFAHVHLAFARRQRICMHFSEN